MLLPDKQLLQNKLHELYQLLAPPDPEPGESDPANRWNEKGGSG